MNRFLSETNFDFSQKTVLLRIDGDIDLKKENGKLVVDQDFRLKSCLATIKFLLDKNPLRIILLSHLGRPGGKEVKGLSLEPIARKLSLLLKQSTGNEQLKVGEFNGFAVGEKIVLLENLRFIAGEEENDKAFAQRLASLGEVYINEAFGVSHRQNASIVGLPKYLPSFFGLKFEGEVKTLSYLKEEVKRPLVFVLGGSKKDKLSYLDFLQNWCDYVLVGGKLPLENKDQGKNYPEVLFAKLKDNNKDIADDSIAEFEKIIKLAKTIIWAGPMGVYEEKENQKGTFTIAKTIALSPAFKVAGGGDTHRVLDWLSLWDSFDFVSVGGGAMLYYLKNKF